jgi:hypothetical protein
LASLSERALAREFDKPPCPFSPATAWAERHTPSAMQLSHTYCNRADDVLIVVRHGKQETKIQEPSIEIRGGFNFAQHID